MPTSNQTTDTNNNSNKKIINGRSEVVTTIGTAITRSSPVILNSSQTNTIPSIIRGQTQLIPSIKHEQHQNQHQYQQQAQPQIQYHHNHHHQQQQHTHINSPQTQTQVQSRSIEELTSLLKDINFDRTSLSNDELIKLVKNQQISVYKLESFLGKDNAARCVEVRRDFYRLELAELDKIDILGINDRAEAFNQPTYEDLEYEKVNGACCENVIGHVKVPVGVAGPLVLDGEEIFVPLATTEGCLVASTCRGLSALRKSGGVSSRVRKDFMTRAPIIRFIDHRLRDALDNVEKAIAWLNDKNNKEKMKDAFNLTSSHGKFLNYTMYPVNREIHIRFEAQTGDAMGMNMCSKGVESALKEMQRAFPTMEIVTLSGNMCTDKKAAGINWINGRGKSVECNAELPAHVVQQVFKVSVDSMIDRWKSKVMVGSALAASIGGFNSQAANILTAIFIATGQDPAQNVTSSNCMLILEKDSKGSLVVCCTMPSIECGTVGGGTILGDQSRYLQMMGVKGPTPKHPLLNRQHQHQQQQQQLLQLQQQSRQQQQQQTIINNNNNSNLNGDGSLSGGLYINNNSNSSSLHNNINNTESSSNRATLPSPSSSSSILASPLTLAAMNLLAPINSTNGYTNARKLARIICATVMAGELSLLAALTEGTLVKSHMRHNRSSTNVTATALAGGFNNSCFDNAANNQFALNNSINSINNNNNISINSNSINSISSSNNIGNRQQQQFIDLTQSSELSRTGAGGGGINSMC